MSRALLLDQAERHGWDHLLVLGDHADDCLSRGAERVRVRYDAAGRIRSAHRWERGNPRGGERLDRLTPFKGMRVVGWITSQQAGSHRPIPA